MRRGIHIYNKIIFLCTGNQSIHPSLTSRFHSTTNVYSVVDEEITRLDVRLESELWTAASYVHLCLRSSEWWGLRVRLQRHELTQQVYKPRAKTKQWCRNAPRPWGQDENGGVGIYEPAFEKQTTTLTMKVSDLSFERSEGHKRENVTRCLNGNWRSSSYSPLMRTKNRLRCVPLPTPSPSK